MDTAHKIQHCETSKNAKLLLFIHVSISCSIFYYYFNFSFYLNCEVINIKRALKYII